MYLHTNKGPNQDRSCDQELGYCCNKPDNAFLFGESGF